MANGVIVYQTGGDTLIPPGRVVTKGEGANFDTVTERWFFSNGIPLAYQGGTKVGNMYCIGPSDVEQLPGPCVLATITYRGLLGAAPKTVVKTKGVRETNYASITGIPTSGGAVQGRIIDEVDGQSVREIVVSASAPGPSTTPPITTTPGKDAAIIGGGELWTYPYGWICTSFSAEELLPDIWACSEEWLYYHKVIFGT